MHLLGRQGSPDTIAGYKADYILCCTSPFEEGHFQLDDPVERFIPQLANRRVLYRDATSLIKPSLPLGRLPFVI
jgi:hypothetical protein